MRSASLSLRATNSATTTTSFKMPFIVSYNPDSESYDVLQKSPFKWMKSFTYEEDAFNYAKKLEQLTNKLKKK